MLSSTNTDEQLREWILADMFAAPPSIALSAMEELMSQSITGFFLNMTENGKSMFISLFF
jgi:hypothetical protein